MNINNIMKNQLDERDIEALHMHLNGATVDQVMDYLVPTRSSESSGKMEYKRVLRKLGGILSMPYLKREAIENKEAILKNLEAVQKHYERQREFDAYVEKFKADAEQKLRSDGYLSLPH